MLPCTPYVLLYVLYGKIKFGDDYKSIYFTFKDRLFYVHNTYNMSLEMCEVKFK